MTRKFAFLLSLLFLLLLCGCTGRGSIPDTESESSSAQTTESNNQSMLSEAISSPVADVSLAGKIVGTQYINEALGFTITFPEEWVFATEEEIKALYGEAQVIVADTIELSDNTEACLMFCSQYQLTTQAANPNIAIALSNVYVDFSKSMYETILKRLQSAYEKTYTQIGAQSIEVTGKPSYIINDQDYMFFSITSDFGNAAIIQELYLIQAGNYVLTITQTYHKAKDKVIMDAIMQDIVYTPIA